MSINLFSIVIPTRQRHDTLRYAIQSVLNQTYKDFELIVMDNYSSKETSEVVSSFDDLRIKYYRSPERLSMADNWELGLSHATGEYITFIGDDDALMPDALARCLTMLNQYKVNIVTWVRSPYFWPDASAINQRNQLFIPLKQGAAIWNSKKILKLCYQYQITYEHLPMLYNSFINKELIEKVKSVHGTYFTPKVVSPDLCSGIVNAYFSDSYLFSSRFLSISGISRHSIGMSQLTLSSNSNSSTPADKFIKEHNKDYIAEIIHKNLIPSLHQKIGMASDLLNMKDAFFPNDNEIQLTIRGLLDVMASDINNYPDYNYEKTLEDIKKLARKYGISFLELSIPSEVAVKKGTKVYHGPVRDKNGNISGLNVDCKIAGITDVAQAAMLAWAIMDGETNVKYDEFETTVNVERKKTASPKNYHDIRLAIETVKPSQFIQKKMAVDFFFDLSDGCNLHCIMCGGRKTAKEQTVMDLEVFKNRVLPVFHTVEDFQFGCQNEALMTPYYTEAIKLIQPLLRSGVKGKIVTNGTLLSESKIAEMIDSNIFHRVSISVDAVSENLFEHIRKGANYKRVMKNVGELIRYRNRQKSSTEIEFIFTILKENIHELPDLIILAKELGVDRVRTQKLSPKDTYFVEESYLRCLSDNIGKAEQIAHNYNIHFNGQIYRTKEEYNKIILESKNKIVKKRSYCGYLNNKLELVADPYGNISTPCQRIQDNGRLGNLFVSSYEDIVNGPKFRELLESFKNLDQAICSRCYMYRENCKSFEIQDKNSGIYSSSIESNDVRNKLSAIRVKKSELDNVIPPEIKNDEFYYMIQKMAQEENVKTILEIGSSAGTGSTEAFVTGLKENQNKPILFCMEVSKPRFVKLQNRYKKESFVKCYNFSSVSLEKFPSEDEVIQFYNNTKTALNNYPINRVLGWLRQDIEYVKNSGFLDDGIQTIKRENNIENFDMVLIDGSEFTGKAELDQVYGAKIIMLDDIDGFKNYHNFKRLVDDHCYSLVTENRKLRNGYAVFKRNSEVLPIHFFTIVLNGEPFIRYHISVLQQLSFKWHWHIIEGVADLKHDTAWSLQFGGHIPDEIHHNGLSNDGTTEYINKLAKQYPKNITIYRKPAGVFWDGKLEMVNAPLINIREKCLLWQIDSDELWTVDQINAMNSMFKSNADRTSSYFHCYYFVGPNKYVSSINTWATYPNDWIRVWNYKPEMRWAAHEPPVLVNEQGINVGLIKPFTRDETMSRGITFQHFAYVTEAQVRFKEIYYGYANAVSHWRKLQKTVGPVKPAMYLPWAKNDAVVDQWSRENGPLLSERCLSNQHRAKEYSSMSVDSETLFEQELRRLFKSIMPAAIIETGTYMGQGTSSIIWRALHDFAIDGDFTTIEVNPAYHEIAHRHFQQHGMRIHAELGLTLPRELLPGTEEIEKKFVNHKEYDNIYYDHNETDRARLYFSETDYDVSDNMLYKVMERYDFKPSFVLLDSAGHLGFAEFQYFLSLVKGDCHLMLDDIYHCKHYKTLKVINADPRFQILVESPEKFGFCIAKYTHVKSILFLRPDSIGDNVMAASMLSHIRAKYSDAKISVLCQKHIAEIYESSPFVDAVIEFDRLKGYQDEKYRNLIVQKLQVLNVDMALNSLYSRDPLYDLFTINSGARISIAFNGNLCNISADVRDKNNDFYTTVITDNEEHKPELERHRDFLCSIGIDAPPLQPIVWITPDDDRFADNFFASNNLQSKKTIALFVSAQFEAKVYTQYGMALSQICNDYNFTVVAFGLEINHAINQKNLDAIGKRTINLCGKTTLRQTSALLKRCRLAVGADTGTAHIACAVGTPNVILLGGGHFGRFMPYSPLTSVACLPLECYGCNWRCKYQTNHCIKDIAPEVIAKAVHQTLEKSSNMPRVFMQESSLWQHEAGQPTWKMFDAFLKIGSVEIIPVGKIPSGVHENQHGESKSYIDNDAPDAVRMNLRQTHQTFPASSKKDTLNDPANWPHISIVTPSFNHGQFLEACIDSVLSQNYPNLEYVIMDGGSTDNSVEIIKKYENHLTYWQSKSDGGQYAAINEGFKRTTGKIMTWLNSDDKFHPNAFKIAALIFKNHDDIQWIMGRPNVFDEKGNQLWINDYLPVWSRNKYLRKQFKYIQQEGTFWRRSLWDMAGGCLDTNISLAGDLELWTRFFRYAQLFTVDALLAGFRTHPGQKSQVFISQYISEAETILDQEIQQFEKGLHKNLLPGPDPILRSEIIKYHAMEFGKKPSAAPRSSDGKTGDTDVSNKPEYLISAIVSTCNSEKFIRGCLEDLEAQTIADQLEIIVVNSGSNENEEAIVKAFQEKYSNIKYLKTNKRETVYSAWNRAIKVSSGKYITTANTDDRHRKDALARMAKVLDMRPDITLVYADVIITETENETFEACTPVGKYRWHEWNRDTLLEKGCFIGPQPMWRKNVHHVYGYFDETFVSSGDYEFWLRISQTSEFFHIKIPLGLYLKRPDSIEHKHDDLKQKEDQKITCFYAWKKDQKDICAALSAQ